MAIIEDATWFYETVRPAFAAEEIENSLLLDVAKRVSCAKQASGAPAFMLAVSAEGRPVAAALQTPPHALLIGAREDSAIAPLVDAVLASGRPIEAVFGPAWCATRFAEEWAGATGGAPTQRRELHYRALDSVAAPRAPAPGWLRSARAEDRAWLVDWWLDFAQEADLPAAESGRAFARKLIDDLTAGGRLFVWQDKGRPVATVGYQPTGINGARIMAVRTDPTERGKGYASIAVATLTHRLLRAGRGWCGLFADTGNPLSNRVYERLGYRPACRFRGFDLLRSQASP